MIAMAITLEFLILMCFHDCEVPTCNCNLQGKMNFITRMAFVVLVVHINVNNAVKVTDNARNLSISEKRSGIQWKWEISWHLVRMPQQQQLAGL